MPGSKPKIEQSKVTAENNQPIKASISVTNYKTIDPKKDNKD